MLKWFGKKETPPAPAPTPVVEQKKIWFRVEFHRAEDGSVYHEVQTDRRFFEDLDRKFKDQDIAYDPLMDEKTKVAVFLHDYLMKTMEYDRLVRNFMSMIGEPYFRVLVGRKTKSTEVTVDSDYNKHLIYDLDKIYAKNKAPYDPNAEEHVKIAVYLYDIVNQIARQHLPEDEEEFTPDDPMINIPALAVRGGQEVRTVVDLGNINPEQTGTIVDVRQ